MSTRRSPTVAIAQAASLWRPILQGRGLLALRLGWITAIGLLLTVFAAGMPVIRDQLQTVCTGGACQQWQPGPGDLGGLRRLGLSIGAWAVSFIVLDLLLLLTFCTTATVLVWRRSGDRMARFCAFMLLGLGVTLAQTIRAAGSHSALWWWPVHLTQFLSLVALITFFYVFPDGRFVPRWTRWTASGCLGASAVNAFVPWEQLTPAGIAIPLLCVGISGLLGSAIVAQVHRYRRVSDLPQRLQTKWAISGFVGATVLFALLAFLFSLYLGNPAMLPPILRHAAFLLLAYNGWRFPFLLIPLSIGVAVLRYRLFDIDIIINRTLVYGGLTTGVIGFYMLVVGYLGALFRTGDSLVISLLATGLVAVLFQPLRQRLQRGVNRLMYGERDEPYAVMSRLGQRLEAALAHTTVLPVIVETTAQALKLPYAAIALQRDDGFAVAASVGTPVDRPHILPLSYQGEALGRLLLAPRAPGEPFTPADRRLLNDLARQAGIAVYAVRLTADLQRSRERLVTAAEEERRRLRRDLHDGLGPTLASLFQRLDVAGALVTRDPAAAVTMLDDLKVQVKATIAEIRRLVYALRPPTLDEYGLVAAIRQHASQYDGPNGFRVLVAAPEDLPPLPAAVEVAAYRIALEAITNVTRHAGARTCRVTLQVDGALSLEIRDDGAGLPATCRAGIGMTSMRERAAELGGECSIDSAAGGGTRVIACLPLAGE